MKYRYEFIGGELHKMAFSREVVELLANGHSEDLSELRAQGACVHREELDNQPLVDGYLSPMWDGLRYNGKYEWEATEEDKAMEPVAVIRYESQEVYNKLSH